MDSFGANGTWLRLDLSSAKIASTEANRALLSVELEPSTLYAFECLVPKCCRGDAGLDFDSTFKEATATSPSDSSARSLSQVARPVKPSAIRLGVADGCASASVKAGQGLGVLHGIGDASFRDEHGCSRRVLVEEGAACTSVADSEAARRNGLIIASRSGEAVQSVEAREHFDSRRRAVRVADSGSCVS